MKPGIRIWLVAATTALLAAPHATWAQIPDVTFVATPPVVVDAMLELAGVGPEDYVIDLGSGDGRIVIAAAKKRGARGLGVELDGGLVGEARREARRQGVDGRVEFRMEDLLRADIRRATVVTLYVFPGLMMGIRPRLLAELRPGTRIVSHEFGLEAWQPDAHVTVPAPGKRYGAPSSEVLLWIVPADARGTWRWRSIIGSKPVDCEVTLSQEFQKLAGSAAVGGRLGRIEAGAVRGEEIRFSLAAEVDGRALRHEFRGRIDGDAIRGIVKPAPIRANPANLDGTAESKETPGALESGPAGGGEAAWVATRVGRGHPNQ